MAGVTDLLIAGPVAAALASGAPVVALESTLITHGLPYPRNMETARLVEATVREHGAVPATIALMDGQACIGLDDNALDRLASDGHAFKASRRDLAPVLAQGRLAGTTVAATMFLAARAGIGVFATGGIGGVHRGAAETFDISADLVELARSGVAVVCAGAKSLLDIALTLEFLETQGVPVIGYGTDAFPAFYARDSGHRVDHRFDSPAALAAMLGVHRRLGLPGGVLIANPVPAEHALQAAAIEAHIAQATDEARMQGVRGKALTPFLLARIVTLSGGESLAANIALIRNNAALAAQLAGELARLG